MMSFMPIRLGHDTLEHLAVGFERCQFGATALKQRRARRWKAPGSREA